MKSAPCTIKNSSVINRRQFLRTTGSVALAFPLVIPTTLRGSTAPSNRINLGIIGCGGRASGYQGQFGDLPDVRIVACADPKKDKREAYALKMNAKYGAQVCTPYSDFRDVLAREDVDAVTIATPDHWHVPLAILAARAGKDMYVEKPLSVALAWSFRLREEMQKRELVFQYGTQQRSSQNFRKACELVRNGYIGELTDIHCWCPNMDEQAQYFSIPYGTIEPTVVPSGFDFDMWSGPAPLEPYSVDRCRNIGGYHHYAYSLGFIAGWGAHQLDILQWALNKDNTSPVLYEGTGTTPPPGYLCDTVERWDVHMTYSDGTQVRFMDNRTAESIVKKYHYRFEQHGNTFIGTEGWLSVDRGELFSHDRNILRNVQMKDSDRRLYASSDHFRNFIDCIKSRKATISPLEAAIRSDTISHLSDICIRTGRPVKWDPEREKLVGGTADQSKFLNRPMRDPWSV